MPQPTRPADERGPHTLSRWAERAARPVDGASLAAFRVLFGLLLLGSTLRFAASGWVARFWVDPDFHFRYWGFAWVPVPSEAGLHGLLAVQALCALLLALGAWTRAAALGFALSFLWTELIDVTTYLNHYYLVTLLTLLLAALPSARVASVDAWRARRRRGTEPVRGEGEVPAWTLWLLRAQFGLVWTFAGVAKLEPDWWRHAWPLTTWLHARSEFGWGLFDLPETAYAFAWGGLLYDLTIAAWLSWRRTRPAAFALVVGFHVTVGLLFQIGIFPFLMVVGATLFFDPAWPRQLARRLRGRAPERLRPREPAAATTRPHALPRGVALACGLWLAVQVAVPLRSHLYPGSVIWQEEGMRWSWRVMLREKHGDVSFRVRQGDTGAEVEVSPRRYLDGRQEREMSGQADLVWQLAQHIGRDFTARGWRDVQVRATARVSLNGRPPQLLIDPTVDLLRVDDGLGPKGWLRPAPTSAPPRLGRRPVTRAAATTTGDVPASLAIARR